MLNTILNKSRVLWLLLLLVITACATSQQPEYHVISAPDQLSGTINNSQYTSANNDFIMAIPYSTDLVAYPQIQIQETYADNAPSYVSFAISPTDQFRLELIPKATVDSNAAFNKEAVAAMSQEYLSNYSVLGYNENTSTVGQPEAVTINGHDGFYFQIILLDNADLTTYLDLIFVSYNDVYVAFETQQTLNNNDASLNEHLQERYNSLLQFVESFREIP